MKKNIAPKIIWENPLIFIACGFGSGAMPYAPGTFGTLMIIPFYLLIQNVSLSTYLLILFAAIIFGIWICDLASKTFDTHDHPSIVFDEFVGFAVTMIAAPKGWLWILLGFILFRIFDIWKPLPIKWFDQHIKNGLGVVLDDVIAGVYAFILLQLLAIFFR